jgi:hypothetical protein
LLELTFYVAQRREGRAKRLNIPKKMGKAEPEMGLSLLSTQGELLLRRVKG